jgi:hypothetical protein
MDWIHLAQVTDYWRDFVNKVMNLRVSKILENFCVTKQLATSEEGRIWTELVSLRVDKSCPNICKNTHALAYNY